MTDMDISMENEEEDDEDVLGDFNPPALVHPFQPMRSDFSFNQKHRGSWFLADRSHGRGPTINSTNSLNPTTTQNDSAKFTREACTSLHYYLAYWSLCDYEPMQIQRHVRERRLSSIAPSCKTTIPLLSKRYSIAAAEHRIITTEQRRKADRGPIKLEHTDESPSPVSAEKESDEDEKPKKAEVTLHQVACKFAASKSFNGLILFVILLNTAILIATTSQSVAVRCGWVFSALDNIFLGIYLMEIVIKLYAWRKAFFNEGWNVLDFVIVVCSVVDFVLPHIIQNVGGFNGAAIFRILRIFRAVRAIRALRVLKTIRFLNTLQAIMTTLLQSIKSIGAIVILISLFMYMFAVVGRGLYAEADPNHFGNLIYSLFTLFQLLTLDDWFEIYTTVTQNDPGRRHVILYLLLYIVVEYFIFLNLFVAVLVDNFQLTLEEQSEANQKKKSTTEEHDDYKDFMLMKDPDDETIKKERKTLKDFYPTVKSSKREFLSHYFRLLTALEHTTNTLSNQQRILDMMVDMCVETSDSAAQL